MNRGSTGSGRAGTSKKVKAESNKKNACTGDTKNPKSKRPSASSSKRATGFELERGDLNLIKDKIEKYAAVEESVLSAHDLNECISEVMRTMLASNNVYPAVPVSYKQLADRLKELQSRKTKIATTVIQHAQKRFTVLGWEMVELGGGSSASYVLRSMLPGAFLAKHIMSEQELAMAGLKLVVQMFLHAKGDTCSDDDMHNYLNKFGLRCAKRKVLTLSDPVREADKRSNSATFGHANPLQALLEQKFLKSATVNGADGAEDIYELGPAAAGEATELEAGACAAEIQKLIRSS